MLFSEVIGQESVKEKLKASVLSGRIPHAQMFFGPEGSGTLAMALAYAQYVACTNRTNDDACNECHDCRKYSKLIHPDLHFAYPVNTSKKVAKDPVSDDYINEWRTLLLSNPYFTSNQWYSFMGLENKQGIINKKESETILRKLNLKSFESDYKIMIVWLPEKMNASSANTLLKLIEEPPEKTLFLLVSESPDQVLLTISSRTQPVKLSRINDDAIQEAISGEFNFDLSQLENIVRLANGNLIQAHEIIESSEENIINLEKFVSIMRLCWSRKFLETNAWVDEMASLGRERIKNFFIYALRMIRENFILNLKNTELVYLTEKEAEFSTRFHPYINGNNVIEITKVLTQASADIERNAYAKIVLFDMSLQLMKLISNKTVSVKPKS